MKYNETAANLILASVLGTIMIVVAFVVCSLLQSCTYSITMVHTEGAASDIVDQEQDAKADIKPVLTVPLVP